MNRQRLGTRLCVQEDDVERLVRSVTKRDRDKEKTCCCGQGFTRDGGDYDDDDDDDDATCRSRDDTGLSARKVAEALRRMAPPL